jgi:dTDP-glucose pyrophosphorylase
MKINGRPLIEYSFDHITAENVTQVVIITRLEKQQVIEEWLVGFKKSRPDLPPVRILILEPEGEWPKTLLRSRFSWTDRCLVLLPDTEVRAPNLALKIDQGLRLSPSVWGVVEKAPEVLSTFGVVHRSGELALGVCEKPVGLESPWVWGCFGFQKQHGEAILMNLEKSTYQRRVFNLPAESRVLELESFDDHSRQPF